MNFIKSTCKHLSLLGLGLLLAVSARATTVGIVNDGVFEFEGQYLAVLGLRTSGLPGQEIAGENIDLALLNSLSTPAGSNIFNSGQVLIGAAGLPGGAWTSGLSGATPWSVLSSVTIGASDIDRTSDQRVFGAFFFLWDGTQFTTQNLGGISTFNAQQSRGDFPLDRPSVPDAANSSALVLLGLGALAAAHRRLRR